MPECQGAENIDTVTIIVCFIIIIVLVLKLAHLVEEVVEDSMILVHHQPGLLGSWFILVQ